MVNMNTKFSKIMDRLYMKIKLSQWVLDCQLNDLIIGNQYMKKEGMKMEVLQEYQKNRNMDKIH